MEATSDFVKWLGASRQSRELAKPGSCGAVATLQDIDGSCLACGGWTRHPPGSDEETPGVGHVRHFATRPDAAGRGFGSAILDHCRREARRNGITTPECFSSLNAEPFHAARGFTRQRDMQIELPGNVRFPAILMRCTLD
jgi:GNAT superfamily N-acetyltransferase